jgi:hypothetical protein
MPIIRCTLAKDGKLVPTAVEFEPGDQIQFKSDQPVRLRGHGSTEVRTLNALALNALTTNLNHGVVEIGFPRNFDFDQLPMAPPSGPPHHPVTISIVTELAGVAAV